MTDEKNKCKICLTTNKAKEIKTDLDFLLSSIKMFDPTVENLESWFAKYEIYTRLMKWTDKLKVDNLIFFLHPSLIRVINQQKLVDLNEIKKFLIDFINELICPNSSIKILSNCKNMLKIFDQYRFSSNDAKYWLECYLPLIKIKNLVNDSFGDFYDVLNNKERDYLHSILSQINY